MIMGKYAEPEKMPAIIIRAKRQVAPGPQPNAIPNAMPNLATLL